MSDPRFFVYRLRPPRPTFPDDITPDEAAVMREHVAYWTDLLHRGVAVVFGPVAEPTGTFGLAVVEVADAEHADRLRRDDPVSRAGLGSIEMHPMRTAIVRPLPVIADESAP
ncbi:MAG: YciI family protein [Blastococcus sp.]